MFNYHQYRSTNIFCFVRIILSNINSFTCKKKCSKRKVNVKEKIEKQQKEEEESNKANSERSHKSERVYDDLSITNNSAVKMTK